MQKWNNILFSLLILMGMGVAGQSCRSSRPLSKTDNGSPQLTADQLFMTAERYKLQQQPEKAIHYFKAFQKHKPDNATASYEIAKQYNLLKNQDSVLLYARRAARLDTANKWMQQFFAQALSLHNKFDSAAAIFHQLTLQHPYSQDFPYQEALMLSFAKKYRESLQLFNRIEAQQGTSEELVYQKQRLYLKLHKIDSAAGEIQKLITTHPDNGRYYALLAKLYAQNEQPEKAIEVYQTLLSRQPDNPQAELALGILYKQTKNTNQFQNYIKKAFRNPGFDLEKKIRFIFPFLSYVTIDSAEKKDALWLCDLLTRIHKKDARAYALYGDMYYRCKEPDSALFQYKKALNYSHAGYEIWNQIMVIYTQKRAADSLLLYSQQAIKKFPDNAKARYFNGMALLLNGQTREAASELQGALQMGVSSRDMKKKIYTSLEIIYLKLNHKKTAARYKKMAEDISTSKPAESSVTRARRYP